MEGVIILDEKQYMFKDVTSVSLVQSDKQFTIRLETATNQFSDEVEEDLLDTIIGKEVDAQLIPSVERYDVNSMKGAGNVLSSLAPPTVTHASVPKMTGTNIRVSVEKPESPKAPDLNPLVLAASLMSEPKVPAVPTQNQPSAKGILIPDKADVIGGQRFALGNDATSILNRTRIDFGVVVIRDQQRDKLTLVDNGEEGVAKVYKKNLVLKSEPFTQLSDASVRLALQTLVMKEQDVTHSIIVRGLQRDEFENFLFVEEPTQLVVVSIINEQQGIGEFYYEEMVSVYQGGSTRTKVDNGKGDR